MFPIVLVMYWRLAIKEARDSKARFGKARFGKASDDYKAQVPGYILKKNMIFKKNNKGNLSWNNHKKIKPHSQHPVGAAAARKKKQSRRWK